MLRYVTPFQYVNNSSHGVKKLSLTPGKPDVFHKHAGWRSVIYIFTLYSIYCICFNLQCIHCNKKWAKRSFPLENNRSEEGKFPCGYWNIYPASHTVFIHSSVREKCSRLWTGTFNRSKKGNFLELSFLTDISGKFLHSLFLKDISGKFPHSHGKNVLGTLPLPGSF